MKINWHEIPFIRFLIPFLTGIIAAIYFTPFVESTKFLLPFLFVFLLLFHFGKRFILRPFFGITLFLFLFCLGNTITIQNQEILNKDHYSNYIGKFNFIEGKIINEPINGKSIKCEIELNKIGINKDSLFNCSGKIIIYFKKELINNKLNYGDLIIAKINLNKIEPVKNPFAFNYKKYLNFKNINYQGYLQQCEWKLIKKEQGNVLFNYAIKSRQYFNSILNKYIQSENENAVANALILGNKNELSTEIKNAYSGTGAIHVLAVSGLHVGIILILLNLFFGLIKSNNKSINLVKTILMLFGIWGFALITGAAPSVVRAATMLSLVIVGKQLNRSPNIYNTIAAAAFLMLLWNPYQIVDVGFQLSFLALIGIIYFQPIVYKWWYIQNPVFDWVWKLASVAIAAQITTLPISFYYFHQFPVYFLLSGIVVIPAATIILWLGILLFVFSMFPPVATVIGFVLEKFLFLVNSLIYLIMQLPGSLIKGIWIGAGSVLLLYLMISVFIYANETKKTKWLMYATSIFLLFNINHSFQSFKTTTHSKIQVYHSNKNSIIDIFDGNYLTSITNKSADPSDIDFATQNNRWANRIKSHKKTSFKIDLINDDHVLYQNGFIHYKGKTIFVPYQNVELETPTPIKVDYVLIRDNCRIPPKKLFESIQPKEVILDASNHRWTLKKWETYLNRNDMKYYNIVEKGAMTIEIE